MPKTLVPPASGAPQRQEDPETLFLLRLSGEPWDSIPHLAHVRGGTAAAKMRRALKLASLYARTQGVELLPDWGIPGVDPYTGLG